MPNPKIGGYVWRQTINRAVRRNQEARKAIRQAAEALNGRNVVISVYLTNAVLALTENLDALHELESIGEGDPHADAVE